MNSECFCGSVLGSQLQGKPTPLNPALECPHVFCYICLVKTLAEERATVEIDGFMCALEGKARCPFCNVLFERIETIGSSAAGVAGAWAASNNRAQQLERGEERPEQQEAQGIGRYGAENLGVVEGAVVSAARASVSVPGQRIVPVRVGRRFVSPPHPDGNHECEICGRRFKNRQKKDRCKEVLHSPYACPMEMEDKSGPCERWFSLKQECKKHCLKEHGKDINCGEMIGLQMNMRR